MKTCFWLRSLLLLSSK